MLLLDRVLFVTLLAVLNLFFLNFVVMIGCESAYGVVLVSAVMAFGLVNFVLEGTFCG